MKNIFSSKYKYENAFLYTATLLCFSLIAYYNLRFGPVMSSDSLRFSRWADELIRLDFNFFEFFSLDKAYHRPSLFFFSVPVLLIALCKIFFVNEWQYAFVLLNLIFVFLSLLIFVKNLLIIKVRPTLISLSLPIIVISVDILTWPRFILSDMIYAFLIILSIYFITKVIVKDKVNYFKILLIIFLLLASRPSSVPVIFVVVFFIAISKFKIFLNQKNILLFVLAIFISIPFVLSLAYSFVELNFNGIAKVDFLTNMVKEGIIVHDRPNTWVDKPNNLTDVILIFFLRLINFFNPYASTYSTVHIALNTIQIVLVLLSISMWSFFEHHIKIYNQIFLFIILLSFSVAAFHSFILIDYDWRYRFPLILPLIMLLPISLEILLRKKYT